MKGLQTMALAMGLATAVSLAPQAYAAKLTPVIPPAKKGGCTDSGLGGPICNYIIPNALLTDEQFKLLQQFNQENAQKLQNLKATPK